MLVSYNWLSDYLDLSSYRVEDVTKALINGGIEVASVEKLVNVEDEKIVIGYVNYCVALQNSDKLSLCHVNVGDKVVQIVCGASNIREGIYVIVALEGAVINGVEIKETKIRGEYSYGMICSLQELGVDANLISTVYQEGIFWTEEPLKIGANALEELHLNDYTLDLELTANRVDCLSVYGIAYDLSALLNIPLKSQTVEKFVVEEKTANPLELVVNSENVSYYSLNLLFNIQVNNSPAYIQSRLMASGIKPKNNVVDITNYILLEFSQPLHAFDCQKTGMEFEIRSGYAKEKVVALNDKEYEMTKDDILISSPTEALAVAGITGLVNSCVDEQTSTVVLECGVFASEPVKQTSKTMNLRTDASLRFEKGIDYQKVELAKSKAISLLIKHASAKIAYNGIVVDHLVKNEISVDVNLDKINLYLGTNLSAQEVSNIFKRLMFSHKYEAKVFSVDIPSYRRDLLLDVDLIEEVMRVYGINNIPAKDLVLPLLPIKKSQREIFELSLELQLRSMGFSEVISYSLTSQSSVESYNIFNLEPLKLLNPLSIERSFMRVSLLPSLLETVKYNNSHNNYDLMLYESSIINYEEDANLTSDMHVAGIVSGDIFNHQISSFEKSFDFYYIKGCVERLLQSINILEGFDYEFRRVQEENLFFHPYQSAEIIVFGEVIGFVGKIHPNISKNDVFAFEISALKLYSAIQNQQYSSITSYSKYPMIKRDLTFWFDKNILGIEVIKYISQLAIKNMLTAIIVNRFERSGSISYTIRFSFQSNEKTLTDEEINDSIQVIREEVKDKLGGEVHD